MKTFLGVLFCFVFLLAAGAPASALDARQPALKSQGTGTTAATEGARIQLSVPLWSSRFSQFPLALVNDEPVTLEDLTNALASTHEEGADATKQAGKIDYSKILDRLINVILGSQEASNIGLDELPEFKSALDNYSRGARKAVLLDELTRDVKTDPVAVENLYKEAVTEWKIKSLLFEKEGDAKSLVEAVKAGKNFDELAKKAIEEKKAKGGEQGQYMKPKDMQPALAKAVSTLEVGALTPVIALEPGGKYQGFLIIRLEDKRYPENAAARKWAEQTLLARKKNSVISDFKQALYKKEVTIRDRTVDGLDYDVPKEKLEKLVTDTRVIAEIRDEKPVTVRDLTLALNEKHFHGLERAAEEKKINPEKRRTLNELIDKVLLNREAVRRGIDNREEYLKRVKDFKDTTLFGLFIDRAVYPGLKLKEEDVKAYYQAHNREYVSSEKIKMTSLVFGDKKNAESALAKLRKGDSINWVRANADGLVSDANKSLSFLDESSVAATDDMPEDMRKAVARAKAGDFRLYAGSDGLFYVLAIEAVTPPQQKTFEEVSEQVRKSVFGAKLAQALEDWFSKLRAAADIKVYLSGYSPGTGK